MIRSKREEIALWDITRKARRLALSATNSDIETIVKITLGTLGYEHSTEALRCALRRDDEGAAEALREESDRTLYELIQALEVLTNLSARERSFRQGRSRLEEVTNELNKKRGSW